MKLMWVSKFACEFFHNWLNGALITATLISLFWPQIFYTLLTFLTPKKEEHFFQGVDLNLRATNKVSISDYTFTFVPILLTNFASLWASH